MENMLRVSEVASLINCSVPTINNWYRFKKENPDNEFFKALPDFISLEPKKLRLWKATDIPAMINFKNNLPRGCAGLMASVTQKYANKKEEE